MGVNLWGGSPLCDSGNRRRSKCQFECSERESTRRRQLRRGNEPWEGSPSQDPRDYVQKPHTRPFLARRVCLPIRSRPRRERGRVNEEFARGQFTSISGEIRHPVPGSRACPKARAVNAKATRCFAEVSRGRSTVDRTPTIARRTERL